MLPAILETLFIFMLFTTSILTGWLISHWKKKHLFHITFYITLFLILLIGIARWINILEFIPPVSWIASGKTKYIVWGVSAGVLLTSSLAHLSTRTLKLLVCVCLTLIMFYSISPFLLPCLMYHDLKKLSSRFDSDGICHQSTGYTCGPASAVTALKKIGIEAKEGNLAILFRTTPLTGTDGECIRKGIEEKYNSQGIECDRKYCARPQELSTIKGAMIVQTCHSFMVDHYVAILEVGEDGVILGDPLFGKRKLSYSEFRKIWRNYIIVLSKNNSTLNQP